MALACPDRYVPCYRNSPMYTKSKDQERTRKVLSVTVTRKSRQKKSRRKRKYCNSTNKYLLPTSRKPPGAAGLSSTHPPLGVGFFLCRHDVADTQLATEFAQRRIQVMRSNKVPNRKIKIHTPSRGVRNIFPRHRCRNLPEVSRPPSFWRPKSKYWRHNSNIWCQNIALNSDITDKIQIKQKFVPLKTSRFVREKLPTDLI